MNEGEVLIHDMGHMERVDVRFALLSLLLNFALLDQVVVKSMEPDESRPDNTNPTPSVRQL